MNGKTVQSAIEMLTKEHGYHNYALSYSPDNPAKQLYQELGFVVTGEWEDDEVVARLSLTETKN